MNTKNLFSIKYLLTYYLPNRLIIYVLPVGIVMSLLWNDTTAIVFGMFVLFMTGLLITKYVKCKKKHESLIIKHGDIYIISLEKKIANSRFATLIDKSWVDMEPK